MNISGMSNNYTIPISNINNVTPINTANNVDSSSRVHRTTECETCKNRKYMDGSNENVSFKTPGHIAPGESYGKVMAHEQEHVANAIAKTSSSKDANLVSVSVSLKMGVCPECGRTYVAGGTTSSLISYEESNPYEKNRKSVEATVLPGQNIDKAV